MQLTLTLKKVSSDYISLVWHWSTILGICSQFCKVAFTKQEHIIFRSVLENPVQQSFQKHDVALVTVKDQKEISSLVTSAALVCSKSLRYRRQARKKGTSTATPGPTV